MINIGIIGAGPNAAGHARYYQASSRAKVVAIADPDAARGGALATEVGARHVPDFTDFLADVDAVVVSSPNFLHREHAIAAASAGKHVYCEKPMGLSLGDARAIAAAVNAARVQSAIGFSVRFGGDVQTMLRMTREGALGQIISICSRRLAAGNPVRGGWRSDHAKSGGLLLEINVHEIDWMMAVGGPVQSVYARTWAAEPTGPRSNDHIWVTLNFEQGPVGMHEGSWVSTTPQYYRAVQGLAAGISTDEWSKVLYFAKRLDKRATIQPDPPLDARGRFLDCIEHGAQPVADVNWGVKVMAVAEAILASANSGQVVPVQEP